MESNDDQKITVLQRLWLLLKRQEIQKDTREEIEKILEEIEEKGIIDEELGEMLHNIVVLKDTTVSEIMVPKVDMVALEKSSSIDDLLKAITSTGCSRIPIYEDNMDNIIGVVYAKDVLKYWNSPSGSIDIKTIMHPPYFVPEGKKLIDLLKEFKQRNSRMAIIIDEYGNVDGLLTMGDIMVEIVGDMIGEGDEQIEESIIDRGDDTYYVDPKMAIDEFAEAFAVEIPEGDYDTIGGFITYKLEKIPKSGETFEYNGILFEIAGADKKRISKLIVHGHLRMDS